jgi:hypothetical protein
MPLTKEQWAAVEKEINSLFGLGKLKCDTFVISIKKEYTDKSLMRMGLMVYVDGCFKGAWLTGEDDFSIQIRTRFYRQMLRHYISKSALRKCGYRGKKIDEEFTRHTLRFPTPIWGSFAQLKRHLIHNNKEISIVPK